MKKKILVIVACIIFLTASAYVNASVTVLGTASRGLMMEWRLDENTGTTSVDASGNGNSATLFGSVSPLWVSGRFGNALSFDGLDQFAESNLNIPSLGTINAPYSISTWVKIPAGTTSGNVIHISNNSNGLGWCIPFIAIESGKFSAISYNGTDVHAIQSDTPSTDVWHHVVTTWSSSTGLRLYVDGVLKSTAAQTNFAASGSPAYVQLARGAGCTANTGFFRGSIDDVRVYNKVLSQVQISALFSSNTDSIATISSPQTGLRGDFYAGDNFNTFATSTIDQTINFDPADYSIGSLRVGQSDHFTARWTGYITPQYTEDYTFYTVSDDGARLYVGDQNVPLIDTWVLQGATEHSNTIHLLAGHKYPIKLEFWENDGGATITLAWSSDHVSKQIIPANFLSTDNKSVKVNDSRNARIVGGLIGAWSFDGHETNWTSATTGTVTDRSGNVNNGTLVNMNQKTSPTPGKIGQALLFNGSNECVTTPLALNHLSSFTLAGWIYPRNYDHSGFFGQNNSIEFGFDGTGYIDGWTAGGGQVYWLIDSTILPINKWHHVAFVGDGTKEVLYVDGNSVVSHSGNVLDYGNSGFNFNIGGCGIWNDTGDYFTGKMDDIRVYNRPLSAGEMKQLYVIGK